MIYIEDNLFALDEAQFAEALRPLPEQRREVVLRQKSPLARRQSLLAYRLLCRALEEEYDINEPPAFVFNQHGKPLLEAYPNIHFNLSHCREAVACAVSNHPIGIDIESIRTAKPDLVRYTMNESEAQHILSSPLPDVAFTRLWTRKEAVGKLLGSGITNHIQNMLTENSIYPIETTETVKYIYSVAYWPTER